jgi:hypothetical protein
MRAGTLGRWVGQTAVAVALGVGVVAAWGSAASAEITWGSVGVTAGSAQTSAVTAVAPGLAQPDEITWG